MFQWTDEDLESEHERMTRWKEEDPIALQDAFNTSQALVDYCKEGTFEEVRQLIDEGEFGEFLYAHVAQAFLICVTNLKVDHVRKFLEHGLDLQCEIYADGLHHAVGAIYKDPSDYRVTKVKQMIYLLIFGGRGTKGLAVDVPRVHDGFTPLCIACVCGFVDVVELLIKLEADVNTVTRFGKTPLEIAIDNDHEKVVAFLRTKGACESSDEVMERLRPGFKQRKEENKKIAATTSTSTSASNSRCASKVPSEHGEWKNPSGINTTLCVGVEDDTSNYNGINTTLCVGVDEPENTTQTSSDTNLPLQERKSYNGSILSVSSGGMCEIDTAPIEKKSYNGTSLSVGGGGMCEID